VAAGIAAYLVPGAVSYDEDEGRQLTRNRSGLRMAMAFTMSTPEQMRWPKPKKPKKAMSRSRDGLELGVRRLRRRKTEEKPRVSTIPGLGLTTPVWSCLPSLPSTVRTSPPHDHRDEICDDEKNMHRRT
jgi:hypothetical protein